MAPPRDSNKRDEVEEGRSAPAGSTPRSSSSSDDSDDGSASATSTRDSVTAQVGSSRSTRSTADTVEQNEGTTAVEGQAQPNAPVPVRNDTPDLAHVGSHLASYEGDRPSSLEIDDDAKD